MEARFFERLEILDTTTVLPLVLFLYREPAVSVERRRSALEMIESWLVRRMLMGLTAKNYNQQIPLIVGRVAEDPSRADEIVFEELSTGIGEISRWPEDDELRRRLAERGMYGYVAQARLAMVLAAVEESLYTSKVERLSVPSKLSIEHILPQSWSENWPLPPELTGDEFAEAEAERDRHLHLIGNLTLTTLPLNFGPLQCGVVRQAKGAERGQQAAAQLPADRGIRRPFRRGCDRRTRRRPCGTDHCDLASAVQRRVEFSKPDEGRSCAGARSHSPVNRGAGNSRC